jgi:hypothetical protein
MDGLVFPALVVSLSAGALWLFRRRLRRPVPVPVRIYQEARTEPRPRREREVTAEAPSALFCPTCRQHFPAGLRFCPRDARPLLSADEFAAVPEAAFPPQRRAVRAAARRGAPLDDHGRICPQCTQRYGADDAFCGRDGAPLVAVN